MKYILINSIGEYPEDFLFAKVDIEKKLIEDGEIEKRMKLEEFILFLNIQDKVYMNNQKSIAFSVLEGLNDNYVFYSFLDAVDDKELFDKFTSALERKKFKFDKLSEIEPLELLNQDVLMGELFMINFKICR